MKLLLTSGGITNPSLAKALFSLVGKKAKDTSLVFVPTASNVELGDKTWLINDLTRLQKLGFKALDIADISAVEPEIWRQKFAAADILFFEGGNTYHLLEWMNNSGLTELMPEYLQNKVYVGLSAGSMVLSKNLCLHLSQTVYEEDLDRTTDLAGLNLVDFYVLPHLNSPYFTKVREQEIREASKNMSEKIYVLDDQSAVMVHDKQVQVISEGKWFEIN